MRHHSIGKWISTLATTFLLGISLTAHAVTSTTTLTTTPSTAAVGINFALKATVTGSSPTGTVTFKDGATVIGSGTLSAGTFTLNTSFDVVGAHSITALYDGDANNTASTSTAKTVTVTAKATTATITVNPTSAVVGTDVILTASITGFTPTGTVTFKDGSTAIGSATLDGSGTTATATMTTSFSTAASHNITAVYGGDSNDAAKTSASKTVTVTKAATTTTLTTSGNSAAAGQSVTLTANVAGFSPAGTVTFKDGTSTLGTGTLSAGVATFNAVFTTVASHSITAVYAGNTNNNTSTSAASVMTVTIATSGAVLTAPASAPLNQSVALVASVSGYTPTGTVTFKEGTTTLGTASLSGSGVTRTATLNRSFNTLGAHSITALYAGDANDTTSTSAAISINITPAVTTSTLTISPTSANLAQSVTLSATVTGLTPTGTVTFKDGTTILGTGTLTGTGTVRKASLNTSFSTAGTHSITVEYAGDTDDATSVSAATNIAISSITSTALSANTSVAAVDNNVTYTAAVTGSNPTGVVTFSEGTTTLGSATLANVGGTMKATLTTNFNSTGIHSVSAAYAGDAQNVASISSAITTQVITAPPPISITAPANNASYVTGAISITTNAMESEGIITQVAFYEGTNLIGTSTEMPFSFNWTNVPNGSYTLSAIATDYKGTTTATSPVLITVTTGVATIYYIHTDQLDTPRLITDQTNNPVWRWDSTDPFANNPVNDDPNATGNHFTFNQRFPGQYYDSETNTHYNYFRDYDPSTGRYIESDPIGLDGGINTYGYVEANPLSYVDPEGLKGGPATKGTYYPKGNKPTPATPSTNDPGNTEDTLGVGTRGAGCMLSFLSEAAAQACMPMTCVQWLCKPSCGEPYRVYRGQHSFTDPDTKCKCEVKIHDINTPVENGL